MAASENVFDDDLAPIYDRLIRWDRRIAFETPHFEALWRRFGTRRLLDAACGSGRHLMLWGGQGLDVTGADASSAMIAQARAVAAALPEPRPPIYHARWDQLAENVPGFFDAVLCLGNSIAYAPDRASLEASLAGLWSKVAPGGFLLIQWKNFDLLRARGERFLPLSSTRAPDGAETIGIRQYDWLPEHVDFSVIILDRPAMDAEWRMRHWSTPLATWAPEDLLAPLGGLAARCMLYGSLALDPFDPASSDDAVILARREPEA